MAAKYRKATGEAAPNFRPVVLAPTYNNAGTLLGVLERIETVGLPVIVVDDGSTDKTPSVLAAWARGVRGVDVKVVTHDRNRGKGAALQSGFAQATRAGYSHAVTMDTDGQLLPEEMPALLAAAAAMPGALVLGRRSEATAHLPASSLVGWSLSGLGLWVETGLALHDSQCGLRVYPLALFDVVRCRAGRFGFESEVIARAVWAGCPIVEVPVTCHYPPPCERVSHFKPARDGVLAFFMHGRLALRRMIPWPHPTLARPPHGETIESGARGAVTWDVPATASRSLADWASPLPLWRQVRSSRMDQLIASAAVGHGAFWACLPLGPWAFAAAAYGSRRLHHNLWGALLGAALVLPPVGPAMAKVAIGIGHAVTRFARPDFTAALPGAQSVREVFGAFPLSWCVGGVLLGTVLHWVTLGLLVAILRGVDVRTVEHPK